MIFISFLPVDPTKSEFSFFFEAFWDSFFVIRHVDNGLFDNSSVQ